MSWIGAKAGRSDDSISDHGTRFQVLKLFIMFLSYNIFYINTNNEKKNKIGQHCLNVGGYTIPDYNDNTYYYFCMNVEIDYVLRI